MIDWTPLQLTFGLAALTTGLLLLVGLPLGYGLAYGKFRGKAVAEALIAMPLVLPPTVLGFYLLLLLSPNRGLGAWLNEVLGLQLVFSFEGIVLASMIYSLPFMVQPIQAGFQKLPAALHEAAYVLGKNRWQTLFRVLLPNMKPALLTACVLSFAHTIGEFGIVLMIGGNIPGETRVASIAIYDEVEQLNYDAAHLYAGLLLGITFVILLLVYGVNREGIKSWHA
ncbi:MAG: molybdate ABC transporter permease subunit [Bacteroidota bacterium]